jgi:DUF4097 and DUF4098 domain-containing protein YvlB
MPFSSPDGRRRRAGVAVSLLLLVTPAVASARAAREEVTREFSRTVSMRAGQAFQLDHQQGDVVIGTHSLAEARIVAHIRVSAPSASEASEALQQVAIDVQESPTAVAVRTRYPDTGRHNVSYAVDYDITLPETAPLLARNSFGDVSVKGLKAEGDVRNSHGRLTFTDARGRQRLENSFGAVEVARVEGDVSIINQNGAVRVAEVQGALDVSNRFASVEARSVRKGAVVVNSNGSVLLADAGGPSRITNSFGTVEASLIRGDLAVLNGNGNVSVRGVSGAADLKTSFGSLTFEDVGRALIAVNSNGRVGGRKVGGPAEIRTSFGAVEVALVQGDATVTNSNGAVTLRDVAGAAEVRSTFGRIEVRGAAKGVRIIGGNGEVVVSNVGPAFLKTSFGLVQAASVAGSLEVENSNGAVHAADVKGPVTVRTSFAAVVLSGVEGPVVDVRNQNGGVEVEAAAGRACTRINLVTSFAPIRVRLPEGVGYDVTARTSFGSIHSEMPLTASGTIGADSLNGRIGAGGCAVSLTDSNGNIEILKAVR